MPQESVYEQISAGAHDVPQPVAVETDLPRDALAVEDYRGAVTAAVEKLQASVVTGDDAPAADGTEGGAQPRDPKTGQFATKGATAPEGDNDGTKPATVPDPADPAKAPAQDKTSPTQEGQDAQSAQQASTPAGGPPPGWSADSKKAFAALPPSVQADVIKREQEVSDGFRRVSERLKQYEPVEQVLAPRRQFFAQNGFQSDGQVVNHLISYADAMERDPAGTLKVLAQAYKLDLAALAGGQPAPQGDEYVSPEIAQLRTDNLELRRQLGQVSQTVVALQQGTERQQSDRVQREAAEFARANPHFETVRPMMAALIQSGQASTLQDAYQMAVWANPTVREQMQREASEAEQQRLAQEREQQEAEAARQRAQATERARKAGVQVRGAPAGRPSPAATPRTPEGHRWDTVNADDVRADVMRAVEMHSARA